MIPCLICGHHDHTLCGCWTLAGDYDLEDSEVARIILAMMPCPRTEH